MGYGLKRLETNGDWRLEIIKDEIRDWRLEI